MSSTAVVCSTQLAAKAADEIVRQQGNAVDVAIAAVLVSMSTEPGVCALSAGGYLTIWSPDGRPVTIDGNVSMPGHGGTEQDPFSACTRVRLEYGGGLETLIGPGSVATPTGIAALAKASRDFGRLPWAALVAPAVEAVRDGFPMSPASYGYLKYSGESIFGADPDGRAAIFHKDGRLRKPGETVRIPHLAKSLEKLANDGPESFYSGDLGMAIVDFVRSGGGLLTRADMVRCRPVERASLIVDLDDWEIALNPPPAIGGATLAAMLVALTRLDFARWGPTEVAALAQIQASILGYRRERLDWSDNLDRDVREMLERCVRGEFIQGWRDSSSTVHTYAVDENGLACAVTMSSGYGSGLMPPGTGIWLNNSLGELELNRRGFGVGPPGTILPSNMAPTVARRRDGTMLAVGSPGADRITTALVQFLLNHLHLGMGLQEAVDHPRVHAEFVENQVRLACEPGVPVDEVAIPLRVFDELSMFFGGVAAACWHPDRGFATGADPRRAGSQRLATESAS